MPLKSWSRRGTALSPCTNLFNIISPRDGFLISNGASQRTGLGIYVLVHEKNLIGTNVHAGQRAKHKQRNEETREDGGRGRSEVYNVHNWDVHSGDHLARFVWHRDPAITADQTRLQRSYEPHTTARK